jgi:hypothetical protein
MDAIAAKRFLMALLIISTYSSTTFAALTLNWAGSGTNSISSVLGNDAGGSGRATADILKFKKSPFLDDQSAITTSLTNHPYTPVCTAACFKKPITYKAPDFEVVCRTIDASNANCHCAAILSSGMAIILLPSIVLIEL